MGSRKKTAAKGINIFLKAYRKLGVDERIAYKAWAWWYGRRRLTLYEMYKMNMPVEQWRHWEHDGCRF